MLTIVILETSQPDDSGAERKAMAFQHKLYSRTHKHVYRFHSSSHARLGKSRALRGKMSETQVWVCLAGMFGDKSLRHAQNPLSVE